MKSKKIIIGISSCLLGEKVRYDGQSKRDDILIKKLHQDVTLLPICPEVEIGMPVPRERLNLIGSIDSMKMIAEETDKDWTFEMREFSQSRILKSDFQKISGLILKSKSPSCGINSVKFIDNGNRTPLNGTGLFADVVMKTYPTLPIIEADDDLHNGEVYDDLIRRVTEYLPENN